MSDWLDPDGVRASLAAAVVLLGAMLGERLAVGARFVPYFRLAVPLPEEPLPLVKLPEAIAGRGPTVAWAREGHLVTWWVEGRGAPRGMHGNVRLEPGPRGVRVRVSWFPPLLPLVAAAWLLGIGAQRGEVPMSAALASFIVVGVFAVHRPFAVRAAAELRYSLSGGGPTVE